MNQRRVEIRSYLQGYVQARADGTGYLQSLIGNFCTDMGTSHLVVEYSANVQLSLIASLDAKLEAVTDSNGQIVGYDIVIGQEELKKQEGPLWATAGLSGEQVSISGGWLGPSYDVIYRLVTGLRPALSLSLNDKVVEQVADIVAGYNDAIHAQKEYRKRLPNADPAVRRLLLDIVNSPALHAFVEQHFQEIVFLILINDTKTLQQMILEGGGCEATKLVRASMPMPPLYTNVSGSCSALSLNPTDDSPQDFGRYYADAACMQEVAFRPTPHTSGYCAETLVTGTANTHLGNAADWTPDYNQPNDPLPSVPSQKWTTSFGTQVAITTESLSGKTVPFMKRIRYREVVTPRPVANLKPLYWTCWWAPGELGDCVGANVTTAYSSGATLLGYVKTVNGFGSVPLYSICTGWAGGPEVPYCNRVNLTTVQSPGATLLGYVKTYKEASTVPLSWVASSWCDDFGCAAIPQVGSGSPVLGYVYQSPDRASCALEMRVYKKNVNATHLPPLMALHGGAWKYRGAAFAAFEAQIAHYTEQGFVVFAPFYRLTGEVDGNIECNGAAWNDLTADAEAALDWVRTNGPAFGAGTNRPVVMGQSAGAHLAGWLITYRPSDVTAGMLLYAPTDLRDFVTGIQSGRYDPSTYAQSVDYVKGFFGVSSLSEIDPSALSQNSYSEWANGSSPPVFMIHGLADETVPSNQSVLLCNTYGGNASNSGGGTDRRAINSCGLGGSELHLFEQGEHGLDGCISTSIPGLCLAGDSTSRDRIVDSLRAARTWLQSRLNFPPTANAGANQTVYGNTTVTLSGSGSDSDGAIVGYHWTQEGGPAVTISNPNLATTTFTAPKVTSDTLLTFKLTVTDDLGATGWAAAYVLAKVPPPISIPNLRALYWTCWWSPGELGECVGANVTTSPGGTLLGYVKTIQEPGTKPLYSTCTSWDPSGWGGCNRVKLSTTSGSTRLGYIQSTQVAGTARLTWALSYWCDDYGCAGKPQVGASASGSLLGYIYTTTTLPPY